MPARMVKLEGIEPSTFATFVGTIYPLWVQPLQRHNSLSGPSVASRRLYPEAKNTSELVCLLIWTAAGIVP